MSEQAVTSEFELIYRTTRTQLLAYLVRRVGEPADAADLLAETYTVVWRRRDDWPDSEEIVPWLYGIARNLIRSHVRSVFGQQDLTARLALSLSRQLQSSTPATDVVRDLRLALEVLREGDRELLRLTAWEGLSPAQIATVTGKSPESIRVGLHRARQRLRAALDAADVAEPERAVLAPRTQT